MLNVRVHNLLRLSLRLNDRHLSDLHSEYKSRSFDGLLHKTLLNPVLGENLGDLYQILHNLRNWNVNDLQLWINHLVHRITKNGQSTLLQGLFTCQRRHLEEISADCLVEGVERGVRIEDADRIDHSFQLGLTVSHTPVELLVGLGTTSLQTLQELRVHGQLVLRCFRPARLVWILKDLIKEDRGIQCHGQADRMCHDQVFLGNLGGFRISETSIFANSARLR